jgi:mono/diheme cytochrome c family protein
MKRILLIGLFIAVGAAQLRAQDFGDPKAGFAYARKFCVNCHALDRGDRHSRNPEAPSFEEIAHTPGATAMAISAMLLTSHATMPNFMIPEEDRANVIAYILSLKE